MRTAFDRNVSPACEYCCYSKRLTAPEEMLCSKQGVVRSNYSCKQFKYNPLKRIPKKTISAGEYSKSDFSIE